MTVGNIFYIDRAEAFRRSWNAAVSKKELEPLPSGSYKAVTKGSELIVSRRNKTPGVRISYITTQPGKFLARVVTQTLYLTPNTLSWVKPRLVELGVKTVQDLDAGVRPGQCVTVYVSTYVGDNGRTRTEVTDFQVETPPEGRVRAIRPRMTPEEEAALEAELPPDPDEED